MSLHQPVLPLREVQVRHWSPDEGGTRERCGETWAPRKRPLELENERSRVEAGGDPQALHLLDCQLRTGLRPGEGREGGHHQPATPGREEDKIWNFSTGVYAKEYL